MKKYLFSLFIRFVIALSGLTVFLISLKLFGFAGRGIMAYGMSIFSTFGILLSFNLGRAFLRNIQENHIATINLLNQVLLMNLFFMLVCGVVSILFWLAADSAQSNILIKTFFIYSLIIPYCIWSINGPVIFASIQRTFHQDLVILITRIVLIIFGVLFLYLKIDSLNLFIFIYCLILSGGALLEMLILYDFRINFFKILNKNDGLKILRDSIPGHLDFIAFNLYPALLILIAGISLDKDEIGEINYVIQMINLIFIFGFVASLKVKSYTAVVGFRNRLHQIVKLMLFTTAISIVTFLCVDLVISYGALDYFNPDLHKLRKLYLITGIAIFGYIMYQFSYPIILESGLIKQFSKLNWINLVILVCASFILIPKLGQQSVVLFFSIFHVLFIITSIYILRIAFRKI